VRKNRDI